MKDQTIKHIILTLHLFPDGNAIWLTSTAGSKEKATELSSKEAYKLIREKYMRCGRSFYDPSSNAIVTTYLN